MKRSEMVSSIAIELMSRLPEWEKSERIAFANDILQCVEIEGMLPPTLECGDSGNMKVTELLDYSELDYTIQWEDEDD